MRSYICSILLLIGCSSALAQNTAKQMLVTATDHANVHKKAKALTKARLQVMMHNDTMVIYAGQMSKLPKKMRKIIATTKNGSKVQIRRNEIKSLVARTNHSDKSIQKFVGGHGAAVSLANQWLEITPHLKDVDHQNLIEVRTGWFGKSYMQMAYVPVTTWTRLPAIDIERCEEIDRYFELKKLTGYGLERIKYQRYYPAHIKRSRKTFQVYFEKNKTSAVLSDIAEIQQYLKEHNLSIVNVKVEGHSSIEGNIDRNDQLHNERARVLLKILGRNNIEPITLDTVIVSEGWEEFRKSIRPTRYAWLDTLSNDSVRLLINGSEQLQKDLEIFFQPLRRASLHLTMSQRLSAKELLEIIKADLLKESYRLHFASRNDTGNAEARILGIFQFVEKMIADGNATMEDLAGIIDNNYAANQVRILYFYHFIKQVEEQQFDKQTLDSVFTKRQWNNLFSVANDNIIALIESSQHQLQAKRIRQAVDVQYYTVMYIEKGILSPEILCAFKYPDRQLYYGLQLQWFAAMERVEKAMDVKCFSPWTDLDPIYTGAPMTLKEFQSFTSGALADEETASKFSTTTWDTTNKDAYYFFVKKLFLDEEKVIKQYVTATSNLAAFDLYNLLAISVKKWDPVTNHYYDSAIRLRQLNSLIKTLKTMDDRICPIVVNQLYLDFALKSLQHIQYHGEKGNIHEIRIAETSLDFIARYYKRVAPLMFKELGLYVVDGLSSFYWIPTKKASTEFALDVLTSFEQQEWYAEHDVQDRLIPYSKLYPGRANKLIKSSNLSQTTPSGNR